MGELSVTEEDYVIAVDGGLSYCGLLHVEPDLIIGDCDSMTEQEKLAVEQLQQTVPEKICRLLQYCHLLHFRQQPCLMQPLNIQN